MKTNLMKGLTNFNDLKESLSYIIREKLVNIDIKTCLGLKIKKHIER